MDAEASEIGKLPGEFNPRPKFQRKPEIFPTAGPIIAGGESWGNEKMVEESEVEIEASVEVSAPVDMGHNSHERKKLEALYGRSPPSDMEFVFDFKLCRGALRPQDVISPRCHRNPVGSPRGQFRKLKENSEKKELPLHFFSLRDTLFPVKT